MVTVNGKTYNGNNVSVINNVVYIDGKIADCDEDTKVINISIVGNIEKLDVDNCDKLEINGDCGSVVSKNGNITCANVTGDVTNKNGNINCKDVGGSVETKNGDIYPNKIKESVELCFCGEKATHIHYFEELGKKIYRCEKHFEEDNNKKQ